MNSGVFFAVEKFSPAWQFSIFDIFLAFLLSVFLFCTYFSVKYFRQKKSQKSYKKSQKQKIIFPPISDANFIEKIFKILQDFMKEKYLPKNTRAHSSKEILTYVTNDREKILYQKIEQILFENTAISDSEKNNLLQEISAIIL